MQFAIVAPSLQGKLHQVAVQRLHNAPHVSMAGSTALRACVARGWHAAGGGVRVAVGATPCTPFHLREDALLLLSLQHARTMVWPWWIQLHVLAMLQQVQ